MFNDAVSTDVNLWNLKERNSKAKKTMTLPNIVDAASGMHIACNVQKSDVEHAVDKLRACLASLGSYAQVSQSGPPSCTDQQGMF